MGGQVLQVVSSHTPECGRQDLTPHGVLPDEVHIGFGFSSPKFGEIPETFSPMVSACVGLSLVHGLGVRSPGRPESCHCYEYDRGSGLGRSFSAHPGRSTFSMYRSGPVGKYERVAFEVLELAFGDRWHRDDTRVFSFGPGAGTGEVSGTLDGQIAVQVAAGSQKQIRGDLLDLMWHPLPLKLLILVDSEKRNAGTPVRQAATIMAGAGVAGAVVRLAGTPSEPLVDVDLLAVQEFVEEWTAGRGDGVRMLDVRERREDVIRF